MDRDGESGEGEAGAEGPQATSAALSRAPTWDEARFLNDEDIERNAAWLFERIRASSTMRDGTCSEPVGAAVGSGRDGGASATAGMGPSAPAPAIPQDLDP